MLIQFESFYNIQPKQYQYWTKKRRIQVRKRAALTVQGEFRAIGAANREPLSDGGKE